MAILVRRHLYESLASSFLTAQLLLCLFLHCITFALFINRAGKVLGANLEARGRNLWRYRVTVIASTCSVLSRLILCISQWSGIATVGLSRCGNRFLCLCSLCMCLPISAHRRCAFFCHLNVSDYAKLGRNPLA